MDVSFGVFKRGTFFLGTKHIFFFEHHVNSYFAGAHLILRESLAGDSVNVIFNGNIPQQINSAAAGKQQYVFTQQKNNGKVVPPVERLPGEHQDCIWKFEREHRLV